MTLLLDTAADTGHKCLLYKIFRVSLHSSYCCSHWTMDGLHGLVAIVTTE